jgi:glycosyltransferase involved in cell wall biosynthesis
LLGVPIICYQRGNEWNSPVVRRLAPHVACYLANSEATKSSLISLGVASQKIRVVYPPIETAGPRTAEKALPSRADFGVPPDAPCFGIIGQLLAWKGQTVFLKAAKRVLDAMPEARAWVIGGVPAGGDRYASELRELAASLGIEGKVVFTGFVRDVPGMIRLLDVVIHASLDPEPFGRVIGESMAMRKPVIASDAGGPREIIEHGRTGFLVVPGDHEQLAERILMLLNDKRLAATVAEAGYHSATSRFSAEAHAKLVQAAYTDILDSPRCDPDDHRVPGRRHPQEGSTEVSS